MDLISHWSTPQGRSFVVLAHAHVTSYSLRRVLVCQLGMLSGRVTLKRDILSPAPFACGEVRCVRARGAHWCFFFAPYAPLAKNKLTQAESRAITPHWGHCPLRSGVHAQAKTDRQHVKKREEPVDQKLLRAVAHDRGHRATSLSIYLPSHTFVWLRKK